MRKETGSLLIEWYDELGHKAGSCIRDSVNIGKKIARLWESLHPGNSVVISRILYNTHADNEKWSYNSERVYSRGKGKIND